MHYVSRVIASKECSALFQEYPLRPFRRVSKEPEAARPRPDSYQQEDPALEDWDRADLEWSLPDNQPETPSNARISNPYHHSMRLLGFSER